MRKFFQHIRKKPKAVRDNYAFGIAASFTLVVMLIWVVAQPEGGIYGGGAITENVKNSPFSTFIKESKEQMASLKAAVSSEVKNAEEANPAVATSSTDLMLNQEDLDLVKSKLEEVTTYPVAPVIYREVMISTTSDSRLPAPTSQNSVTASSAPSQ